MARRVRTFYRDIPRELRDILSETEDMSSSEALVFIEDTGVQSPVSYPEFREILRGFSKRYKVPVKVSKAAFEHYGVDSAEAFAAAPHGKYMIYVHPILRYNALGHIQEVLLHELDHIKVMKRQKLITI